MTQIAQLAPPNKRAASDLWLWRRAFVYDAPSIRDEHLPAAHYKNYGPCRDLVRVPHAAEAWTGAISVASRVGHDVTLAELREKLDPHNLHRYYVRCSTEARVRCIDGRCIHNYANDASLHSRPLGPQVPGGTATGALCRRIADVVPLEDDYEPTTPYDYITTDTFLKDIDDFQQLLDAIHWKSGGHIDEHAGVGKTGCGAIDRLPEILARITSPAAQAQLRRLTSRLLGDMYEEATANELMGRFLLLQGHADTYFARDKKTDHFLYLDATVKRLQADKGLAKLVGGHREVLFVVNMVPDTTWHRDQFATDNSHRLQVFNYDLWGSLRLAKHVAATVRESEHRSQATPVGELVSRYVTSRVLFNLATVMVLTDGTLNLVVRSPE